jgi:hypothetical protein
MTVFLDHKISFGLGSSQKPVSAVNKIYPLLSSAGMAILSNVVMMVDIFMGNTTARQTGYTLDKNLKTARPIVLCKQARQQVIQQCFHGQFFEQENQLALHQTKPWFRFSKRFCRQR